MAEAGHDEVVDAETSNIVICIDDTGGHFGDASRWYEEAARNYAFVLKAVERRSEGS